MFLSEQNKVLSLGIVSVLGVVAGAALMGGRCVRHGLHRGPGAFGHFNLERHQLFVALAAILAGCVAALKYPLWQLERSL